MRVKLNRKILLVQKILRWNLVLHQKISEGESIFPELKETTKDIKFNDEDDVL